jgi:hypothetical protein
VTVGERGYEKMMLEQKKGNERESKRVRKKEKQRKGLNDSYE